MKLTTAESWKTGDLAKFMADKWLIFQSKNGIVKSMTCKCCTEYSQKIMLCKNYQAEWASSGCTRLQIGSARKHADTDQHKITWDCNPGQL